MRLADHPWLSGHPGALWAGQRVHPGHVHSHPRREVRAKTSKPLPKQDAAQEPQTEHTNESETMSKTESPIEKIGKLALQANALLAMAKKLTADIETVAIEVEEMFSTRDAETAKLRQLQALLKSLG